MNIFEISKKACLGASAAAVLAMGAQTAQAVPLAIQLTDGVNTTICADGAGCDGSVDDGVVSYNGTVGSWTFGLTAALTYPTLGTINNAVLHLTNVSVSGGSGTLNVLASAAGYLGPITGGFAPMGVSVGGVTAGTVSVDYYLDSTNALFGTASLIDSLGPLGSGAISASGGSLVAASTPFSLTIDAAIHHDNASQSTSIDAQIPEPSLLALVGAGLVGFGLVSAGRRRGRRQEMAAA